MPCFARDFGIIVLYSEITECGKSEQNLASCNYLLVLEMKEKGNHFSHILIFGVTLDSTQKRDFILT